MEEKEDSHCHPLHYAPFPSSIESSLPCRLRRCRKSPLHAQVFPIGINPEILLNLNSYGSDFSLGVSILTAEGFEVLKETLGFGGRKRKSLLFPILILFLLTFGLKTSQRNGVWKSRGTLFE